MSHAAPRPAGTRPPRPATRWSAGARAAACTIVLALLAVLAVSCGIRPDDQPQAVSPSSLPPGLLGDTGTTVASDRQATVYVIEPQSGDTPAHLVAERRNIDPALGTPEAALTALLQSGPPGGGRMSPASGAKLLDVKEDGSTLEINLGDLALQATSLRQAFAQLVYTATEGGRYQAVRFLVDGKTVSVPLGDSTLDPGTPASRDDFASLAPRAGRATTTTLGNSDGG